MLNYFPKYNEFQVLYLQYSKLRQTQEIRFVDDGDVIALEVAVSQEEKKKNGNQFMLLLLGKRPQWNYDGWCGTDACLDSLEENRMRTGHFGW